MLVAARHRLEVPPPLVRLSRFTGSPDTLRKMQEQAWGERGEQSMRVRALTEDVISGVKGKDYQSEILAVRNFGATRLRYTNDPLHVELIKDPERIADEVYANGVALVDCDEIAQMIATMLMQVGRVAEYVVVGFGAPNEYSHVFSRVKEPKSGRWLVCDPVAGSDERTMLSRVTTFEIWSLDE